METDLLTLSYQHRKNTVMQIAENRTAIRVAEIMGDNNELLKLRLQKKSLEYQLEYHESQIRMGEESK